MSVSEWPFVAEYNYSSGHNICLTKSLKWGTQISNPYNLLNLFVCSNAELRTVSEYGCACDELFMQLLHSIISVQTCKHNIHSKIFILKLCVQCLGQNSSCTIV